MKNKDAQFYINHLWNHREYYSEDNIFDYPFYGGLKSKFKASPEVCDVIQFLWVDLVKNKFKTKRKFYSAFRRKLNELGEKITSCYDPYRPETYKFKRI
jgi:hypothetical protein